jgi:hypothetical protein
VTVPALSGGVERGRATTGMLGPISIYSVRIDPDVTKDGCGEPGRTVTLHLNGVAAQPTLPWGGRDEDLAIPDLDVTTVSPPPGPIVIQQVNGELANVAHLGADGEPEDVLSGLPVSWTRVYRWDALKSWFAGTGGYRLFGRTIPAYVSDLEQVARYDALWIDASGTSIATVNPNPPLGRAVALQPGWNSIVYTGTNRQVEDALSSVEGLYTRVMHYDNAAGAWRSYSPGQPRYVNDFGALLRLKVYWVYMTAEAVLIME